MSNGAWRQPQVLGGAAPAVPEAPPIPLKQWTVRAFITLLVIAGFMMALKLTVPCATFLAGQLLGLGVLTAGAVAATVLCCHAAWTATSRRP